MGKVSTKFKVKRKATIQEVYNLNLNNPDDQILAIKLYLLDEVLHHLAQKKITRKELADCMRKTKQEITNRLNGRNLTISFLLKASLALGLNVNIKMDEFKS